MAWNVYLTIFRKKSTKQLRVLEPLYIILCYGIPLVPSVTFLFVSSPKRGSIYGPATLWCWIGSDWLILRVASFYGPAWYVFLWCQFLQLFLMGMHRIVLVATFLIYALAGRVIFRLRKNLRSFAKDPHSSLRESVRPQVAPGRIAITTVDTVETTTARDNDTIPRHNTPPGTFPGLTRDVIPQVASGYSCHIEAVPPGRNIQGIRPKSRGNSAVEANTAAWAYCRCAMLFFLALLITWVRPPRSPSPSCQI